MGLSASAAIPATTASTEAAIEFARSHLFDTSGWREFCDVTLTLKQGHRADSGSWIEVDHYRCEQAFRHFMNLLTKQRMDLRFVATASVFVSYPNSRKARSARGHYVHVSVARQVDGTSIAP